MKSSQAEWRLQRRSVSSGGARPGGQARLLLLAGPRPARRWAGSHISRPQNQADRLQAPSLPPTREGARASRVLEFLSAAEKQHHVRSRCTG